MARTLGVSQPTARDYLDIADGTFLWRQLPAFSRDTHKRMVKAPRRHLRSLRDFVAAWGCPFGLVVSNDVAVRRFEDRLIGVPATCL